MRFIRDRAALEDAKLDCAFIVAELETQGQEGIIIDERRVSHIRLTNLCANQAPLRQVFPGQLEFTQNHLTDGGRGINAGDVDDGKGLIV